MEKQKKKERKWHGYSTLPLYAVRNYEKLEEEAVKILKERKKVIVDGKI